ncbi:hypothetical protein BDD12DRAFT_883801 [Trichophaea hybrida]|nr:hypothetical protein BDD12DRAFT_883801 [Trichophaea hybrida]
MDAPAPPSQSHPLLPPSKLLIRNDRITQDWRGYREIIRRLYVAEDHTLSEVKRIMQDQYNLLQRITKQYKTKIKGWNMGKNIAHPKMIKILLKRLKRKNEGKKDAIYFRGRTIPESKLNHAGERFKKELSQGSDIFKTPAETLKTPVEATMTPAESIQWLTSQWDTSSPRWYPWTPDYANISGLLGFTPVADSPPGSAIASTMQRDDSPGVEEVALLQQSVFSECDAANFCEGQRDKVDVPCREEISLQPLTLEMDGSNGSTPNAYGTHLKVQGYRLSATDNPSLPHRRASSSSHRSSLGHEQPSQPANTTVTLVYHLKNALQHLKESHQDQALVSLSQAFAESHNALDDPDTLNMMHNIGLILV